MVLSALEIKACLDLIELSEQASKDEWVGGGMLTWRGAYSYLLIRTQDQPVFGKKMFLQDLLKTLPSMSEKLDATLTRWLDTTETTSSLADWYVAFYEEVTSKYSSLNAFSSREKLNQYLTKNNLRQVI